MLKSPYLFAVSVLVALIQWTGIANAQELNMGLSFELAPVQTQAPIPAVPPVVVPTPILSVDNSAIAASPASVELAPVELGPVELAPVELAPIELEKPDGIALTFATNTVSLDTIPNVNPPDSAAASPTASFNPADNALSLDDWIFENGTHSLVARTVGSAEGTRQSDGRRTQAYYGHTDPGNGVWNLGTFSYQHEATSPEDADEKQLQRLKRQGLELETQATQLGITLSLEEKLNGLDLANQAPLAALDTGGYIDRLAQAKRLKMTGEEAILWARTHAYIDPNTRRWNAPGLGNNVHSISKDQDRRISAISSALKAYSPADMNIASLADLGQISLTNTGVESSTSLIARANEESQPHFRDISTSGLAISFGLPPALPHQTTNEPIMVTASAPPSGPTASNGNDQPEASIQPLGIAFDPTANIANPVAVASLPVEETNAAPSKNSENGSIENESIENAQLEEETAESTDLFTITPQTQQGDSPAIHEKEEPVASDEIVNSTAVDNATRLETLLAGINTTVDPDVLATLKNSKQSTEPNTHRQFFRTEDKIVQEK